ncbi:hypothetical protein [Streptomyces californicus]|uniref:hypothetical protein n=1 Tax=Streptomyces californicus TaxID=67351 RepID=UPI0004C10E43|nr:hypothetical protein [Streptomyces californicus]QRV53479.1 hypothetical protein I6J40_04160 [Streptomyces californicus]
MTYTLADAIRDQFERDHPGGKNTLKCTSCRRRRDRQEFRKLPSHGRAPRCKGCEGEQWWLIHWARTGWELEQARERLRMYQRYAQRLRAERYDGPPLRIVLGMGQDGSGLNLEALERPHKLVSLGPPMSVARLPSGALSKAHTLAEEDFR